MVDDYLRFFSTNLESEFVSFPDALLKGQAPDRGLYLPAQIPRLGSDELDSFRSLEYYQIASLVMGKYLRGVIPGATLESLCKDAYDYPVPLERVKDSQYILRLDQGPTASFKDFAARMMARLMNYYLSMGNRKLLILTATSGDTGSAIANAFLGLEAIEVVVLFPEKEVTTRQRKQMTTLGGNIHILALDAKFDDCQALVKQAFSDPDLESLNLSSANSINIGRLIPQTVYYFYAWSRLAPPPEISNQIHQSTNTTHNPQSATRNGIVVSVPSGNFGDMMGGVMAMKMGLPVEKFIIAVNENDEFPLYLNTGIYQKIEPSRNCISSAMNVGHPSNLARLLAIYKGVMDETGKISHPADSKTMNEELWSTSVTDAETRACIKRTWEKYHVLLEPHGAVGWEGLQRFLSEYAEYDTPEQICVSLETAHPAKFPEEIRSLLGIEPEMPKSLRGIDEKLERYEKLERDYFAFKRYLKENF